MIAGIEEIGNGLLTMDGKLVKTPGFMTNFCGLRQALLNYGITQVSRMLTQKNMRDCPSHLSNGPFPKSNPPYNCNTDRPIPTIQPTQSIQLS